MPTICEFYGITIRMYYDDHAPPHFHAYYAGHGAKVDIGDFSTLAGFLPARVHSMVLKWARRHQYQLYLNWDRAIAHQPLSAIPPLE